MKKVVNILGLLVLSISLISCANNARGKRPVYVRVEYPSDDEVYAKTGDQIAVPFRDEAGVKFVQVKVDGMSVEMIFDTGCSITLISKAEADYLYQKGMLTRDDFLGTSHSQIADGSIVEDMVINLKEVIIDNKIRFTNVLATVSYNVNAPLLLGNEILDRAATITIDNENKTLNFKMK